MMMMLSSSCFIGRPVVAYEFGSVCPSFRPSVCPEVFLELKLVFSETRHGVRGTCLIVRDSQIFWEKSPLGKNDQKW